MFVSGGDGGVEKLRATRELIDKVAIAEGKDPAADARSACCARPIASDNKAEVEKLPRLRPLPAPHRREPEAPHRADRRRLPGRRGHRRRRADARRHAGAPARSGRVDTGDRARGAARSARCARCHYCFQTQMGDFDHATMLRQLETLGQGHHARRAAARSPTTRRTSRRPARTGRGLRPAASRPSKDSHDPAAPMQRRDPPASDRARAVPPAARLLSDRRRGHHHPRRRTASPPGSPATRSARCRWSRRWCCSACARRAACCDDVPGGRRLRHQHPVASSRTRCRAASHRARSRTSSKASPGARARSACR